MTGPWLRSGAPELAPDPSPDRIARQLMAWSPPSTAQAEVRAQMLAFLAEHPAAHLRTTLAGHFTGSALVVDAARERTLLLHHRKLGRWLQPGGHADGDANLAAVALREATEETGIAALAVCPEPLDLDIHQIPARGAEPAHLHLDVRFLVVAPPGAEPVVGPEALALRWCRPEELDDPSVDTSLRRLARRAFAAR